MLETAVKHDLALCLIQHSAWGGYIKKPPARLCVVSFPIRLEQGIISPSDLRSRAEELLHVRCHKDNQILTKLPIASFRVSADNGSQNYKKHACVKRKYYTAGALESWLAVPKCRKAGDKTRKISGLRRIH